MKELWNQILQAVKEKAAGRSLKNKFGNKK